MFQWTMTFLAEQFSLQTIAGKLLWMVVLAGLSRALGWLFHGPFQGKWSEVAFWLVVPAFWLVVILLLVTAQGQTRPALATAPQFKGTIDQVNIGTLPASALGPNTTIVLVATIRNVGSPSIAEEWSLSVIPPGGTPLSTQLVLLNEDRTLTFASENPTDPPLSYAGKDVLYAKTLTGFSVVQFRPDFTRISEVYPMKSHTNQWVRVLLSATEGSYEVLARSPIMVSEGLKPAQCPYQIRFPGRVHLQSIERTVLSWGTTWKPLSILSEVTIRKSQLNSSGRGTEKAFYDKAF